MPWKLVGGVAAAGAALGAASLFNRIAAERAESDNPPAGRFVDLDGLRLHYLDRGAGSPILLLHGNGATSEDMVASGLVERLARNHRVIVPDRPGYGYSDRPRGTLWSPEKQAQVMVQLLDRLGVESPVVVGHSWGALVALALALDAPERARALLLLSGYYYPTARLDVALLSGPAVPALGDLAAHTVAPILARAVLPGLLKRIFQPLPVDSRFRTRFPVAMTLRPRQLRASAEETAYMVPAAYALSRRYRELQLPIVIMAGEGDRIADLQRQSVRLHRELPTSALAIVPGAGHMVHYAATEAVARAADALAGS
ncbi:alpha/beta fold hydrolase [Enterovirga aerilata]|uniref:alpha/beta fold hydrolase n=1 Tax=Enterovirga aerilata TaxID=2730920 RepID=UPI003211E7AB